MNEKYRFVCVLGFGNVEVRFVGMSTVKRGEERRKSTTKEQAKSTIGPKVDRNPFVGGLLLSNVITSTECARLQTE